MLDTVVTFKDLLVLAIGVALIVLIIYLIALTKTLIKTLKKTNAVLDDTKIVTEVAAEEAVKLGGAIDNTYDTVASVCDIVKGRRGVIGTVGVLAAIYNAVHGILVDFGIVKETAADATAKTDYTKEAAPVDEVSE